MLNSPVYPASQNGSSTSYEPPYRSRSFGRIAKALEERFATDPAMQAQGMPPNYGEWLLPHTMTLQGLVTSISRVYRVSDEALNDSFDNARFMEYDVGIWECMEARIRSSVLLDWHIDPEDEKDPEQTRICGELTRIVKSIYRWQQVLEQLSLATWYGRSGVSWKMGWGQVGRKWCVRPEAWLPVHGDKLVFRLMDGSLQHMQNQVGIRVGQTYNIGDYIAKGPGREGEFWQVEPTDRGLAYFLSKDEMKLLTVHKHQIQDAAFERPTDAGRIHGVGIRNRIYWEWFMKQETMRWLMEYLERSAFGVELWFYPLGNEKARQDAETAVKNRSGPFRNVMFVPVPAEDGSGASRQFGVEHIETGLAGADILLNIVEKYFFHRMKRLILGQTLTTEAEATGLGGNLASIHLLSFRDIVKYDCKNRDETITAFVNILKQWNYPGNAHWKASYVTESEPVDADQKLAALKQVQDMGAPISRKSVYKAAGITPPEPGEELATPAMMMPPGGDIEGGGGPDVTTDEGLNPQLEGPQDIQQAQLTQYSLESTPEHPGMLNTIKSFPESAKGMVSVRDLRRKMPHLSKTDFDNLAKRLAKGGNLNLHKHDYVASMTPNEVAEGTIHSIHEESAGTGEHAKGTYYNAVSLHPKLREQTEQYGLKSRIREAAAETDDNPTQSQKDEGNYRKGTFTTQGLEIAIENPKGTYRHYKHESGEDRKHLMQAHYGYVKSVDGVPAPTSKDEGKIDIFVGPDPKSDVVYVVDQLNPKTGRFDECKAMLGWYCTKEAKEGYLANYEPGWKGFGCITVMTVSQFKEWLKNGEIRKRIESQKEFYSENSHQNPRVVWHAQTKGSFVGGKPSVDIGSDHDILGKGFYFGTKEYANQYGDAKPHTVVGKFATNQQWVDALKQHEHLPIDQQRAAAREHLKSQGHIGVDTGNVGVIWHQGAFSE